MPMRRAVTCAVALMGLTAAPAMAQEGGANARRTLGGHTFIPNAFLGDPFVTTTVSTATGAARAVGLEVPILDLDSNVVGTLTGNVAFLSLSMRYQQRLASWVAVRGEVQAVGRLGTSTVSLIAEGASAVYGGSVGATFRLLQGRRAILSAVADYGSNTQYRISPLDFARGVIETGGLDTSVTLLDDGSNWHLTGGLRGAYAFSPMVGVRGLVELGPKGRFLPNEENATYVQAGAVVSLDFASRGVPVGLTGAYEYLSESNEADDIGGASSAGGLGIYYTGETQFAVGLDLAWQRISQRGTDNALNLGQVRISLRYDF
jgi:hypothetical protein